MPQGASSACRARFARRSRAAWSSAAALLVAALLSSCATAAPPTPAPGQGRDAPAAAVDVPLHARVLRMADARIPDERTIDDALASRSPITRAAGVLAIGQIRAREHASSLRALLADADTVVAANAAFALGLMQDTGSVVQLAAALSHPVVGREAAFALGQIGAPARTPIVGGIADDAIAAATLGELLLAASRLRPVPAEVVAPRLRHQDAEVRWRAAYAFARGYAPAGVRPLLDARSDAHPQVRAFAARGLARQAAGDSLGERARGALVALSRDAHPQVRINALRALASYGAAGREVVFSALRDGDQGVRIAAAEALGAVMDTTAARWMNAWSADTGFAYRTVLLASAERAGARPGWGSTWLAQGWRHRAAVAEAAAGAADPARRWAVAEPLTRDADARVRAAALRALASAGGDTLPPVRALLLERAGSGDLWERAAALDALARRPRPQEASRVHDAFRVALADTTNDARTPAARYLAAVWSTDSARIAPDVRAAIRALQEPAADPVTRAAVGGVAPFDRWRTAPGTAQELGWYEERVRELVVPAAAGELPRATIRTERGDIVVELLGGVAPLTVHNWLSLARAGYYDGVVFHRVIPNFVAQDGDPTGSGIGGPRHVIRDELNRERYLRGVVGMALSGPDTGGSQYFLTHSPQPHLDGGYTIFGRVIDGFDALDAIRQGDRILSMQVH